MKRAVCSLFAIGMALGGGARAWADDAVIGAAVERFTQCLAAEGSGATVDDPAALASALGGTVAQFDGIDCGVRPDECARAIQGATCDALAEQWVAALAPQQAPIEVPPWAAAYGAAVRDRVVACYALETGAPLEGDAAAAVDAYAEVVAEAMATMAAQMDCAVNVEAAATCTASIASQPCEVLAGELTTDASGNLEGIDPSCGEMLDCMQAADRMIEAERNEPLMNGR